MEVDPRFPGEKDTHKPLGLRGFYQVYFNVKESGTKYYSEN